MGQEGNLHGDIPLHHNDGLAGQLCADVNWSLPQSEVKITHSTR